MQAFAFSGAELARKASLPNRHMVSRIRCGHLVGQHYLEQIAEVLQCSREWLVNGTGTPPSWAGGPVQPPAQRVQDRGDDGWEEQARTFARAIVSEICAHQMQEAQRTAAEIAELKAELAAMRARLDDESDGVEGDDDATSLARAE